MSAQIQQSAISNQHSAGKVCPICNRDLLLTEFGICASRPDGRNRYCKSCIRAKRTASYRRDVERQDRQRAAREERTSEQRERAGLADAYFKGIYKAQPEHFNLQWPTVRTETIVQMVFGAIQNGANTSDAIIDETKLHEDVIGVAIADLLLWEKKVTVKTIYGERYYFVRADYE